MTFKKIQIFKENQTGIQFDDVC